MIEFLRLQKRELYDYKTKFIRYLSNMLNLF